MSSSLNLKKEMTGIEEEDDDSPKTSITDSENPL